MSRATIALPTGKSNWMLTALPPLTLYIHMPWCVRKCPYCDFNSHAVKDGFPEDEYIDALIRDLEIALPLIWGRRVYSIFFGGGTPSLFSAAAIDRLLAAVRARITLAPEAEITLEANPGTFESDKFRDYRSAGINRLSIGIQSFNDAHLKALGRIHSAGEAERAIDIAHQHFDNFNIDLMYALPGQTLHDARADIRRGIAAASTHLSAYHLTVEPNTLFHRYPPDLPDEELSADMQEMLEAELREAGFDHYETSAFARPGRQSRHNLNYWTFGDYLGIGAGAHSKLSFHDRIIRQMRYKQPREYLANVAAGNPCQTDQAVSLDALPFEFMMNALRLTGGVDTSLFSQHTGLPISVIGERLAQAEGLGLLEPDVKMIRPTLRGQRFLNDLLQLFLNDEKPDIPAGD